MARFRSLLLVVVVAALVLLLLQSAPTATAEDSVFHFCEGSNYTANSSFDSNLRTLLDSLSASNSSFSTGAAGSSNQAFGLVLCRGDVDSNGCETCIKAASENITQLCVQSKQAIVWYDHCQLRYSDVRFLSSKDGSKVALLVNGYNQTDPETFTPAAKELMGKVADRAAHNSSSLLFATGTIKYRSDIPAIYGLAQCTRDLSADVCSQCLHQNLNSYWNSSNAASRGARMLGYNCNFRYEVYTYFDGDPTISLDTTISPSPSPPPIAPTVGSESQSGKGNKTDIGKVLTIAIPSADGLALVVTLCICLLRRRLPKDIVLENGIILHQSCTFALFDLLGATKHIKEKNWAKTTQNSFNLQQTTQNSYIKADQISLDAEVFDAKRMRVM